MFLHPAEIWLAITHLGAAGLMLPMFLLIAAELWLTGQKSDLLAWVLAMSAGGAIVLASKLVFIGWGWGNASLDFTGISGHAMLATSIFPVWMGRLLAGTERRFTLPGVLLGLTIGAAVGVSRLVLGAHSPSEVAAGWLVGLAVSLTACKLMRGRRSIPEMTGLAGAVLLLVFSPAWPGYLPTHRWEVGIALALSGHARPYVRQDLHRSLRESTNGFLRREQTGPRAGQVERPRECRAIGKPILAKAAATRWPPSSARASCIEDGRRLVRHRVKAEVA